MSLPSDYMGEMQRLPLDLDTADRLLRSSVLPEDAPPGYAGVALVLAEVDTGGEEVVPSEDLVALLAAAVRSSPAQETGSRRRSFASRIKFAAALAAAALVGTTGLALAGTLPGAAQDVASEMLAKVGVTVPGPNSKAGDHPNTRGSSSEDTTVTTASSGKGAEISGLATSDLTGLEKGAAVSTAASGGKSKAGEDDAAPVETAPVETPNAGGTATADTASGGASSAATTEADEASGGHSSAGSENAAEGQSNRP
jgi:hypothetical protein